MMKVSHISLRLLIFIIFNYYFYFIIYLLFYYYYIVFIVSYWASQATLVVKNPPANAGDKRDPGSIPGLGRSPGGRHGNPLQ